MYHARSFFVLVPIVLIASIQTGQAQSGNSLRGKIVDGRGNGIPQIQVRLETGSGILVGDTVSSGEGDFIFTSLVDTNYVIVIDHTSYRPVNERVEFTKSSSTSIGETRVVHITLEPRSKPKRGLPPHGVRPVRFAQEVPPDARRAFDSASAYLKDREFDLARIELERALRIFHDYFDARYAYANELIRRGEDSRAIEELELARMVNPNDDRVYMSFGTILMRQKKFAIAAAVFKEASRLNPVEPEYFVMTGGALLEIVSRMSDDSKQPSRGDVFAEIEQLFDRADSLSDDGLSIVCLQRARLYEKMGEPIKAAEALERYLLLEPQAKNARSIEKAIEKLRNGGN